MSHGWINPRHLATLSERIDGTEVRFFSPFGRMPEEVGGFMQETANSRLVLLPSVTGEAMSVHELGHAFAGINGASMRKYYEGKLGDLGAQHRESAMVDLFHVLNEGYNEHMTSALISGSPEVISPLDRDQRGIAEPAGSSEIYEHYREVFSALIGGTAGTVSRSDIEEVVDTMVDRDFSSFARLVDRKWPHRDVLVKMLDTAQEWRNEKWSRPDTEHDSADLAKKLAGNLKAARPNIPKY
jgi:hypothetical protein